MKTIIELSRKKEIKELKWWYLVGCNSIYLEDSEEGLWNDRVLIGKSGDII